MRNIKKCPKIIKDHLIYRDTAVFRYLMILISYRNSFFSEIVAMTSFLL